ncbi:gag-pol polyprotein [Gossypium australe]|uniref:Gag-pol polyprotein n=1 Tax=Gossypium australe TaxID=47621 RepID=A0A5B6UVM1_9ROSI|nr:gag-pol polyprotein [Gossypium australe]
MFNSLCIPVRTPYDSSIQLLKNRGNIVTQLEYAKIIGKFSGYPTILEGYYDANLETDNDEVSSTSGYVFTLVEQPFCRIGQEVEWLRNLLAEIPLWEKPIPLVSLSCDSQATIYVTKSQAYNGNKRHIRIGHESVRHLIKNGVLTLEYVRYERNIVDPLAKGLSRKMVLDSSRGMGLKPRG